METNRKTILFMRDYKVMADQVALWEESDLYELIFKIDDEITRGDKVNPDDVLEVKARYYDLMRTFDYTLNAKVLKDARKLIQRVYAYESLSTVGENEAIPPRKIVYLAGRISGLEKGVAENNFYLATVEALGLVGFNVEIINPTTKSPLFGIKKWLFYMIPCIARVRKSDIVAMQSNWIVSKGAVVEYFFARFVFNKRIIFLK